MKCDLSSSRWLPIKNAPYNVSATPVVMPSVTRNDDPKIAGVIKFIPKNEVVSDMSMKKPVNTHVRKEKPPGASGTAFSSASSSEEEHSSDIRAITSSSNEGDGGKKSVFSISLHESRSLNCSEQR